MPLIHYYVSPYENLGMLVFRLLADLRFFHFNTLEINFEIPSLEYFLHDLW